MRGGAEVVAGVRRLLGRTGNGSAPRAPAAGGPPAPTAGDGLPRRRGAATAALLLAAAALAAALTLGAAWRGLADWRAARQSLAVVRAQREVAAARARRAQAVGAVLAERRTRLEALEATLPARDELPDLLRHLEQASAATGVAWLTARGGVPVPLAAGAARAAGAGRSAPGATAGNGNGSEAGAAAVPYLVLSLTLDFGGDRAALLAFLSSLETALPSFVPARVELTADRLTVSGHLYLRAAGGR